VEVLEGDIPMSVLSKLQVEVYPCRKFEEFWTSKEAGSRKKASIWTFRKSNHLLTKKNTMTVRLGQYASPSYRKPSKPNAMTIQLTDTASSGLTKSKNLDRAHLNKMLPHPIKYRQVWFTKKDDRALYIWRPLPPTDEFVCLGMVASVVNQEPPLDSVRCVPKTWCRPATYKPDCIWDDAGTGGRKGSFWIMNTMQLMQVSDGHEKPKGEFWELRGDKFLAAKYAPGMLQQAEFESSLGAAEINFLKGSVAPPTPPPPRGSVTGAVGFSAMSAAAPPPPPLRDAASSADGQTPPPPKPPPRARAGTSAKWRTEYDPSTGQNVYVNMETGEQQYKRPKTEAVASVTASTAVGPVYDAAPAASSSGASDFESMLKSMTAMRNAKLATTHADPDHDPSMLGYTPPHLRQQQGNDHAKWDR
jgi:hypothetical protein